MDLTGLPIEMVVLYCVTWNKIIYLDGDKQRVQIIGEENNEYRR